MAETKNIFHDFRERRHELQGMVYTSDLSHEEKGHVFNRLESEISESEFEQIRNSVMQRQPSPLTKVRNGETLSQKEINQAVKKACE